MDLSKLQFFQQAKQQLGYIDARHSTIAENIANSDTPGYRPQRVAEPDFHEQLSQQSGLQPVTTQPGHGAGSPGSGEARLQPAVTDGAHLGNQTDSGAFQAQTMRQEGYETTPDGNAVSMEQQLKNLADNQLEHTKATRLYRKNVGLIRSALGGGGGGG